MSGPVPSSEDGLPEGLGVGIISVPVSQSHVCVVPRGVITFRAGPRIPSVTQRSSDVGRPVDGREWHRAQGTQGTQGTQTPWGPRPPGGAGPAPGLGSGLVVRTEGLVGLKAWSEGLKAWSEDLRPEDLVSGSEGLRTWSQGLKGLRTWSEDLRTWSQGLRRRTLADQWTAAMHRAQGGQGTQGTQTPWGPRPPGGAGTAPGLGSGLVVRTEGLVV
ncbi:unnamed protein product [Boreogadus saida]